MNTKRSNLKTILITLAVVLLAGLILFPIARARSLAWAHKIACRNKMISYGCGFLMYAGDHGGRFPPHVASSTRYVAQQPLLFICPASGHKPGESFDDFDAWSDYVYIPGCTDASPPGTVVAYCRPENHRGRGGNILFRDGHAEWFWSEGHPQAKDADLTFEQVIRDGLPPGRPVPPVTFGK